MWCTIGNAGKRGGGGARDARLLFIGMRGQDFDHMRNTCAIVVSERWGRRGSALEVLIGCVDLGRHIAHSLYIAACFLNSRYVYLRIHICIMHLCVYVYSCVYIYAHM